MNNKHSRRGRGRASNVFALRMTAMMALILLGACGGDQNSAPADAGNVQETESTTRAAPGESGTDLPAFLPAQIPLPEEYIVIRDSSKADTKFGDMVELNIALPGAIDEWRDTYREALEAHFEPIEMHHGPTEELNPHWRWRLRFRGQGFERATLWLSENTGMLDLGESDSTHLPVMLTLQMDERTSAD